jgi:hypothetical protein
VDAKESVAAREGPGYRRHPLAAFHER